jgi:membrane-associated phospholipid phosphatase
LLAIVCVLAGPIASSAQQGAGVECEGAPVERGDTCGDAQQPASVPQGPASQEIPLVEPSGITQALRAIASDFVAFPQRKSTWVIVSVGVGGAFLVHPVDDSVNRRLAGSPSLFEIGEWAGKAWVQAAAAGGLYGVGRYVLPRTSDASPRNRLTHLGTDLLRAQLMAQVISRATRYSLRRPRPTGECCSMPSGHAINAFSAASVIERHFGYRGAWPALLLASYVGASRLHDNRHFLSDVVLGSAIGMAIGWTVVGRHGRSSFALQPVAVPGGVMVAVVSLR